METSRQRWGWGGRALLWVVGKLPYVHRGCGVGDPGFVEEDPHSFGGGFLFEGTVGDEGAGEGDETSGKG